MLAQSPGKQKINLLVLEQNKMGGRQREGNPGGNLSGLLANICCREGNPAAQRMIDAGIRIGRTHET